jgi:putative oxidoreductase
MDNLISLYSRLAGGLDAAAPFLLPLAARIVFAGVLLIYFWGSGLTKLGDGFLGFLTLSDGAYVQIFPKAMEAAGYDASQLGVFHWGVAVAGTWAEFILPLLIVLGLMTRLAALGMMGFIAVQSLTDILGHGVAGDDLGQWFDRASGALIADQRALWVLLLLILLLKGAGSWSLDAVLRRVKGLQPQVA